MIERLEPLKVEVLVLYRLEDQSKQHFPSGPSKRRTVQEKAFILMQRCQCFHSRATDLLSEPAPKKTDFSAVMQTTSLITNLGLSNRSHNHGTSYYAN